MFYWQNHIYMLEFKLGQEKRGEKKNLKKSRKGVEKAAYFLLPQEKETMALIHLEVKPWKIQELWHWQLNSVSHSALSVPGNLEQKLPHKTWSQMQGGGAELWKTPPTHIPLNIPFHSLFLIHGKESSGYADYLGICRVFCQKRYKLISNLPSWTNQEVSSSFALFYRIWAPLCPEQNHSSKFPSVGITKQWV